MMQQQGLKMIRHILRHELRRYQRDGRVRTLIVVSIVILIGSVGLSLSDYKLLSNEYKENLDLARQNWEQQSLKDPHDAAHDGTYVIKPIYPLSILDKGIRQYSGQVVHLGAHERKQSTLNESKDHTGMFRFGELTPGFILMYVVPLLLIFLGYNTFTDERDRQTIRLLLTQGVSTTHLALGKLIALAVLMIGLWILIFGMTAMGILTIKNGPQVEFVEWLMFAGVYLLYFFIFINIIVLVSARSRSSGVAITTLLAFWIVVTLIVPKVSTNLAGWSYPFPTLQTFRDNINADQAKGLNGHNFWNNAAQDFQKKVLEEYGVDSIEELPVAYGGLLLAEGEKYESEIYTKHFDLLQEQYKKQRNIYRWSGVLSPLLPVRFVSMAAARSDYGFLWHFEDQAEKYRVEFNTVLNMNIAENAKGKDNYKADQTLWASTPKFEYHWQSNSDIILSHWPEVVIIGAWAIFSFLIFISYSRQTHAI